MTDGPTKEKQGEVRGLVERLERTLDDLGDALERNGVLLAPVTSDRPSLVLGEDGNPCSCPLGERIRVQCERVVRFTAELSELNDSIQL